jgi:hypothetical protein
VPSAQRASSVWGLFTSTCSDYRLSTPQTGAHPQEEFEMKKNLIAASVFVFGLVLGGASAYASSPTQGANVPRITEEMAACISACRSSVSDFIERNTLGAGGRSGLKVFMPTI